MRGKSMRRRPAVPVVMVIMAAILAGCGNKGKEGTLPIVEIKAAEMSGSGVIYERNEDALIILTAGHVLQTAPDSVEVIFEDGFVAESSSYSVSQTSDIAFINISMDSLPTKQSEEYRPVTRDKESFDALAEGEEMTLRGISDDGEMQQLNSSLIYPWIYAEDFQQYMMLLRGEILPGMSGGGVFDEAGNFVGILCGVSEERQIAAVPLSLVLAEYTLVYE